MSNFRRYTITIVILIIISCLGVLLYTIFHDDGTVTVPQVVGMSQSEASEALSKLGVSAKVEEIDSQEPDDTVLTQSVKPGKKVKPGESLVLQVSNGGKQTKIPDVRKMKTEIAIRTLEEAGFSVIKMIKVNDSEHEPSTVMAQNPYGEQSVSPGTSVELLVCEGNALDENSVYVPYLRGKKVAEAEKILVKSQLAVGEKNITDSAAPEGTVIATKPGTGTKVGAGSVINLTVSNGKETEKKTTETAESNVKKESTVKTVKAQPKAEPKKNETKNPVKTELKQVPKTGGKNAGKAAEKQTAKTDVKAAVKETEKKAETKQPAKNNVKAAVKDTEKKAETKQPAKSDAKEAAKEIKAEAKQQEKTETKATETKPEQSQKSTKYHYVVPPLVKPMNLKVVLEDDRGKHVLKEMTVKGNETYDMPIRYTGKATLTILLGGEEICQEKYR